MKKLLTVILCMLMLASCSAQLTDGKAERI